MHHIYILKLIPRLINDEGWTDDDHAVVDKHFNRLQSLKETGKLILAGRTLNDDASKFGIVILNAEEEEARELMQSDPAIKEGIMTGELYPYRVALIAENNI